MNFTWLAANSPVTDLSKANLSKRSDVALYASISGQGATAETSLVVLRFGSPSVAVCDDKDLDLQVTATYGGADKVILRVRIQHVARAQPAEFEFGSPNAVETARSPESPPLLVRYGESAELQVIDQDHKTWACSSSFGASATITSVVSNRPATDAAFCSASRVTFVGSRMPSSSMSPNSPVAAL